MKALSVFVPLVLASLVLIHQNSGAFLKLTNLVCESSNQSWVRFDHCRLKAINRNKTVANINATFLAPATDISLRLQIQKKANGYKPWLFDVTIDACKFVRNRNNPFAKVIWNLFRNYSTANHTCPYVGLQRVKDFHLTPEKVPLPLPTGEYALLMTWTLNQEVTFVTNVYFTYTEDF
ncbi:uncharacterized protein LOC115632651 [Scaptodrosophila lebanonensis]|uniref:Uncharacterized protein LOC115632651 n=1 Tax=Drosophila lebanonensis TaxID=7225 RepID=A0A6J2UB59_DROLE|nr:uncharacterized protein LOC115632651 [Scaptodrosophila lebanonensis]